MNTIRTLPFVVGLAGLAGAAMRGLNLHTGYEPGTSLPIPGNSPQTALIILSSVLLVGLFLGTRRLKREQGMPFETAFGCAQTLYKICAVLAGLIMGASGVAGLYLLLSGQSGEQALGDLLPQIPLWGLAVASMLSFIVLASGQAGRRLSEGMAFFSIFPMFWACFDLIITFKDNGASPFVSLYAFELFAAIALMFAFYSMAGFLYAPGNPARFTFSASLAVFFSVTCVGGYLVYFLLGGGPVSLDLSAKLRYACFGAAAIYLFANLCIISRALTYKPRHTRSQ